MTLVGKTNRCLQKLGIAEKMELRRIGESQLWELVIETKGSGTEALITDVGFGVSQVLPIVVQAFLAPRGSMILVEQPAIHLHPAVQANLADMFITAWNTTGAQFIIESHSEHLLRRVQRALAEEKIKPAEIALYFVTTFRGAARVEPLHVNEYGEIANWPSDFFGNVAEDLKEMTIRRLRRKRGEYAA